MMEYMVSPSIDRLHDESDFFVGHFGKAWQGCDVLGERLRHRKGPAAGATRYRLKMVRNGIVNVRADALQV